VTGPIRFFESEAPRRGPSRTSDELEPAEHVMAYVGKSKRFGRRMGWMMLARSRGVVVVRVSVDSVVACGLIRASRTFVVVGRNRNSTLLRTLLR